MCTSTVLFTTPDEAELESGRRRGGYAGNAGVLRPTREPTRTIRRTSRYSTPAPPVIPTAMWLRTFSEGTQRTYATLVDHLRWLKAVNASGDGESRRTSVDLWRCAVEHAGPGFSVARPHRSSASALQVRAAVLKGYYLDVTSRERINDKLNKQLTETRLPTRALKDKQFLAHVSGTEVPANPLAAAAPPKRHPRLLPDGVAAALIDSVNTARDRMIVTWLDVPRRLVGELVTLHMDLHLHGLTMNAVKRSSPISTWSNVQTQWCGPAAGEAHLEDGVVRGGDPAPWPKR